MIVEDKYFIGNYEQKIDLFSLSPSSKFILYLLKQRGPLKQQEIIQKTLLPKRTTAYALKKLQERNFIKKSKDLRDKRVSIFEVLV
ncbi:MAG: MarR family transcriptional regulator [Promethearchaeota archaeon]|jgi:DNA-binding MarR family transcriptional regulator|nr:MarR family transcriptional regulator [Candidatus Lokiarchaeota archaeon]